VETLDSEELRALAGGRVSPRIVEGLFFPDEAIVDGALLTKALALSAAHRGATILTDSPARRFLLRGGSCVGVETERGPIEADRVVNAAGAWAAFDGTLSFAIPVEPVRGQIVELSLPGVELTTVVQDDDVYLVPRPRGRVLVGATVERVGFRKEVTAAAIAGLIAAAGRLLPDLSDSLFLRAWAGLRPGTPDDLPILGASPIAGLFLAVGHYRNGILLAAVTARGMADLLDGSDVPAFAPFSIDRFRPRTGVSSGPSSGSGADGG
jgi:glycine oxidase